MSRVAVALALVLVAWPASAPAKVIAAPATPGPYEQELAARAARWKAERGKPQAAIAVLGALPLFDRVDPAAVAAFLDAAAADAGAPPLVRAIAAYQAQALARSRGNPARAAELRAGLGIVEAWRVIGPFGFEGGDLIGTPYGPEVELRATEKGKRGDVA